MKTVGFQNLLLHVTRKLVDIDNFAAEAFI